MGINSRGERAHVPCEPLRKEEVPAGTVDCRYGGVAQAMKGVQAVKPGLHLPGPESELDAALADAHPGLGAEEGVAGRKPLAPCRLVGPEFPQLEGQGVRQENIARAATLGDLGADS